MCVAKLEVIENAGLGDRLLTVGLIFVNRGVSEAKASRGLKPALQGFQGDFRGLAPGEGAGSVSGGGG
jgi:hypothetical protein